MSVKEFFQNAFDDMKENAKAQHEVDKANLAAVKAESKAQFEEAKAIGRPKKQKEMFHAECDAQIAKARNRQIEAEDRIAAAKNNT